MNCDEDHFSIPKFIPVNKQVRKFCVPATLFSLANNDDGSDSSVPVALLLLLSLSLAPEQQKKKQIQKRGASE